MAFGRPRPLWILSTLKCASPVLFFDFVVRRLTGIGDFLSLCAAKHRAARFIRTHNPCDLDPDLTRMTSHPGWRATYK